MARPGRTSNRGRRAGSIVSEHALRVLEFHRVLDVVAGRAATDMAKERVRALRPTADRQRVSAMLRQVDAVMRFVEEEPSWGFPVVPDCRPGLRLLAAEGAVLEPIQLHRVGLLLRASRLTAAELDARQEHPPELAVIRERLVEEGHTENILERSVDGAGEVLDAASKELRQVRSRLKGAHARVVRQLEGYMRGLPERFVVTDGSVTIREGRYVIPIRREGRSEVGGIVHDESHTGATLFVEPPIAIELMNKLRELEREEAREIRRILGELSAQLVPLRHALVGALDALVELDSALARARTALAWRASVPLMLPEDERTLCLVEARHPLLLEASQGEVVPYDLELLPGERALVVSGPNTGGKSVFLKATGLVCALAQSGVVPPVGRGTRLPMLSSVFADIGDEQSIAESLSTFSAHLANLADIMRDADDRSLVLIDEMGTGTDPAEGAALAQAVLEALVQRGCLTLVSSHLGQLKQLAGEGTGVVNASLQFDSDRMEPTYHLVKGRPGRSFGLAIARRLGFPGDVIDRAESFRDSGDARMDEILESLERREREAERVSVELRREREDVRRRAEEIERRTRDLREAERSSDERARQRARQLLMEARSEVEEVISGLRSVASEADLDEAARSARRRVEAAAERARKTRATDAVPAGSRDGAPDLGPGSRVRVRATGAKGRVAEVRDDRAVVEVGVLRIELPINDLEPLGRQDEQPQRGGGWTGPAPDAVRTEFDFRGLRVDEIDVELMRALDQAILEDLPELRIIHGKGTGALRQRVGELLAGDARVRAFRMGGPTEGGAGVTVVTLS
jgi:DNA mismatch repair protein MutS2